MAYAAVCCLELTIERLLKSSHISVAQNLSQHIIKLLYEEILSLKEALGEFDTRRSTINMKMVKTLEGEIIDAVYQFEDVIDPHLSDQFHPQSEQSMLFSVDLEEIQQDVDSFIQTIDKMKRAYIHELCNPSPDEEGDDVVPSRIRFGGNESNMVGLSHLFTRIKDRLINSSQSEWMIVWLYGMAGIGKTSLAKKLFHDPFIVSCYSRLVFVTIGPKYRLPNILVDILKQVNDGIDEIMLVKGEQILVELKRMVFESLKYLRYLIVLDDVWDRELCIELANLFPDDNNGSRVLLTTRLHEVALGGIPLNTVRMPFLDKKESWDLLREKVFGEEPCSYGFEKAGKKIAENCEGLPLTIVTVADILSKSSKTTEYWNEVADDKQHSVYKDAYDQMSNVLYPSYNYLEQHLKACFLYLGAFPQNYSVNAHILIDLWSVEGFLNTNRTRIYLNGLCTKTVIMYDRETHGYYLHSPFWYLCNKEASKNKLFYALSCCDDDLREEGIKYQRRLSIRNNILFAIEDVRTLMASASTVRSLLCTGPYLDYPVPLCVEHLRLLRILEARIRFYEFPMEVVKLVQLRYLSLAYDGDLPTSISNLRNLQHLIVEQHLRVVKSAGNLSCLPTVIWNMKELNSLQTGRDLPHPCEGSPLPNLSKLIGVGPQSCTKDVFRKIPHLKTLSIRIELASDAIEPLSCFDHISHLHELEELVCVIVNPILKTKVVTPLTPLSNFPSSLTMLTLRGSFGYPWEELSKISSLPNLNSLKLQCYAFRGPKWEVHENEFQSLLFLEVGDTDLVQWKFVTTNPCLPAIRFLRIEHCYKLKEIPLTFGKYVQSIEVVECNRMVVNCANKLKEEWDSKHSGDGRSFVLNVCSSL